MNVRSVTQLLREWAVGLALVMMVVAPVGCLEPGTGVDIDDIADLASATGFFIGEGVDGAIFAARSPSGEQFFAYGERDGDQVRRIDALLYESAAGERSAILFDAGFPVQVIGPDDSSATITYEEVTASGLRASVLVDDQANQTQETFTVDIDLEQTLAQVAALVEQVTGEPLTVVEVDDDGMSAKRAGTMQTRITVLNPLYGLVVGFGAVIAGMGVVLGQIITGVVQALGNIAQGLVAAIFLPFFAISELLGATLGNVRLVPLGNVFGSVPNEPVRIRITPL